jgi:hypothetical protein
MVRECHHIKTSGGKCGAPALRGQLSCYFHSRRENIAGQPGINLAASLRKELANLEDRGAIQRAATRVVKAVVEDQIDPRRAELILYALQIAEGNAKDNFQGSRRRASEPTIT